MLLEEKEDQDSGLFGVNMTPLIDVSLVLVVILLLLTPLAFESGIRLSRQEPDPTAPAPETTRLLSVRIVSQDSVRVEDRTVARRAVAAELTPLLHSPEVRGVAIDCVGAVSHGAFVDVLDQAKLSGANEIALRGS